MSGSVQGVRGHDQIDRGAPPVKTGSVASTGQPTAVASGDMAQFNVDEFGNLRIVIVDGTDATDLAPITKMPGASEVKSERVQTASNTTTRFTVATPTAGKKARMISAAWVNTNGTIDPIVEIYFGTGAAVSTTSSKVIMEDFLHALDQTGVHHTARYTWPDGAGPVGAVDDVISARSTIDLATSGRVVVSWREE